MHRTRTELPTLTTGVTLLAMALVGSCSYSQSSGPLTLSTHTDKPLHKASPMLYRLMTEEINYSYDGG